MLLNKFRQWMVGRYGSDQLGLCMMTVYLLLSILGMVFRNSVLIIIMYVLFILTIFRMFSKNVSKRYAENQKFLSMTAPIRGKMKSFLRRCKQRKTHKFYKCRTCGQIIRVPRGKGKICISCPKCRHEFIKKT